MVILTSNPHRFTFFSYNKWRKNTLPVVTSIILTGEILQPLVEFILRPQVAGLGAQDDIKGNCFAHGTG